MSNGPAKDEVLLAKAAPQAQPGSLQMDESPGQQVGQVSDAQL
jgi:hypothetical protein